MNDTTKQWNEKIDAFASATAGLNIEFGKMGVCLYFFLSADKSENKQNQHRAEKLLDEIYEQAARNTSVKSIPDLMQVGIGIDFLVKQKYVEGNVNQILGDIDNTLFQRMTSSKNPQSLTCETPGFLSVLYYLYLRLKRLNPTGDHRFLMEELTIKAFNEVYVSLSSAFYDEPVLFDLGYKLPPFLYVLSKIHSLGFYNYRINEVIKEIAGLIRSRIPALHANRLYLLWGLTHLKQATAYPFWDEQINLISRNICVQKIIEQELRNKQVFIKDGVAGIYLLLAALEQVGCQIPFEPKALQKRIYDSDIWKENEQPPLNFVGGMSGLLWVDHLINQRINAL